MCVGDVFELRASDGSVRVRLAVTSPRRPCSAVDRRHGKRFVAGGVRHCCLGSGLAGIFLRVLSPGVVTRGDTLVLVERPHPTWTMRRVSDLLYGAPEFSGRSVAKWRGTVEELHELAEVAELGWCEYREEVVAIRDALAKK